MKSGSIYKNKNSKYYQALFHVWNADIAEWVRTSKSTKCVDKKSAENVLEAFISTAQSVSKFPEGTVLTKDYVEGVVISILGAAGINVGDFIPNEKTIGEYFETYLKRVEKKRTKGTHNSYTSYYNKLKDWLADEEVKASVDYNLSWLTLTRLEDYYIWLLDRMTAKSANERLNLISRVFTDAIKEKLLLENPAKDIQKTTKTESLEREPFTVAEAMKLIDWLIIHEKEWARVAMMGFMAGCRIADAAQMKREAIVDGNLVFKQHKTGKWLKVPLVVKRYREILEAVETELIAPKLAPIYKSMSNNGMSSTFAQFVSSAGITQIHHPFEKSGRKVARKTFHSLRHTLRSAIIDGGGSDAQADSILGHSPGEGKRYTHTELKALTSVLKQALDD